MSYKCSEQNIGVSYSYRKEIEKELLRSIPVSVLTMAQSEKVVRSASGMLRLNLLQCSLLAWLLRNSKYSLVDLSSSSHHISLFEEDHNKSLLLLILLNAYYVKSYLLNGSHPEIDSEVIALIPTFSKIYKAWRPDSVVNDATLSELNITFNSWTQPHKRGKPDYNQLVNKILELSKTYNVGGNEEEPPKKRRKVNEQLQEQEQQESHPKEIVNNYQSKGYMLRSQSIMNKSKNQEQYNWDIDDRNNNDFLRRSTKNIHQSFGYMNFGDLAESRHIFGSRHNVNQSILNTNARPLNSGQDQSPRPKIKITSSFDQILK